MTDTIQPAAQTPAAAPEQPQLNVVWLNNGVPLVIGGGKKAIELMKAQGFQIFYMLTELGYNTVGANNTTKYTRSTRLVKVVSNFVGDAVVEVDKDDSLKLDDIKSSAVFGLPKIPFELVTKMDTFFRYVHQKNKTEAIILLTYDPNFKETDNPGQGWSYIIPKQNNTAGSCKYDPTSIIDDKDDHVVLVGSAHSHPSMSAYASHTDEADQASFDGLHMTFGWAPNSPKTDYHIEMQMGGGRFQLTPEMTFDSIPEVPVDEEMEKLVSERVSKMGGPKPGNTWSGSSGYQPPKDWSAQYGVGSTTTAEWKAKLPKGCPDPKDVTLIRRVLLSTEELKECPVCDTALFPYDMSGGGGKCWKCHCYFLSAGVTLEDLIPLRETQNKATDEINFAGGKAKRSVWVWEESLEEGGNKLVDTVRPLWLSEEDKRKPGGALGLGDCDNCKTELEFVINGACGTCKEPIPVGRLGKAQKITPELPTESGGTTGQVATTTEAGGSGKALSGSSNGTAADVAISCPKCSAVNSTAVDNCVLCHSDLIREGFYVTGEAAASGMQQTEELLLHMRGPENNPALSWEWDDGDDAVPFDEEFHEEMAALGKEISRDDLDMLGSSFRLCCMSYVDECNCPETILFSTVDDAGVALLQPGPYAEDTACQSCVFQYSVECQPYVNLLKNWVSDPEVEYEQLTWCEQFIPNSRMED